MCVELLSCQRQLAAATVTSETFFSSSAVCVPERGGGGVDAVLHLDWIVGGVAGGAHTHREGATFRPLVTQERGAPLPHPKTPTFADEQRGTCGALMSCLDERVCHAQTCPENTARWPCLNFWEKIRSPSKGRKGTANSTARGAGGQFHFIFFVCANRMNEKRRGEERRRVKKRKTLITPSILHRFLRDGRRRARSGTSATMRR